MNDLQSTFLKLSASFSSTSCCFSSAITLKIIAFLSLFVLLCSFMKKKTGSVFPFFCHFTFHHALITCHDVPQAGTLLNVSWSGYIMILVKAMWPRISQWLSLFSWVKVLEYNNYCAYLFRGTCQYNALFFFSMCLTVTSFNETTLLFSM